MLSAARCEACNHALPLRGALRDFRLPPETVTCPGCAHPCPTILPYRVGWVEALVWKVVALISIPACLYWASERDGEALHGWLIAVLGPVVLGGLGGFVVGKLLGFPFSLLRDSSRNR